MKNVFLKSLLPLAAALPLAVSVTTAVDATPAILVAPPGPTAMIQPIAMGDPPTVPRRRGGRQSKGKDKPYQPLAKDPVGETDAAHKEYLKRYGF